MGNSQIRTKFGRSSRAEFRQYKTKIVATFWKRTFSFMMMMMMISIIIIIIIISKNSSSSSSMHIVFVCEVTCNLCTPIPALGEKTIQCRGWGNQFPLHPSRLARSSGLAGLGHRFLIHAKRAKMYTTPPPPPPPP